MTSPLVINHSPAWIGCVFQENVAVKRLRVKRTSHEFDQGGIESQVALGSNFQFDSSIQFNWRQLRCLRYVWTFPLPWFQGGSVLQACCLFQPSSFGSWKPSHRCQTVWILSLQRPWTRFCWRFSRWEGNESSSARFHIHHEEWSLLRVLWCMMKFYCWERTYDSSRTGLRGKTTFPFVAKRCALLDTQPSTLQISANHNSDLSVSVHSL